MLRAEAARRDCRLVEVDAGSVTEAELAGFDVVTYPDNVAIALAVAGLLGVGRQDALAGMYAAPPDPGVLTVEAYPAGDLLVRVANLFAANDPESTMINYRMVLGQGAIDHPIRVVINCRPDRLERNRQMGELIGELNPDRVVLIGEPVRSARAGISEAWDGQVTELGGRIGPAELLRGVLDGASDAASLVLVGNIHGQGEVLLEQLAALPHLTTAPTARTN